MKLGLVPVCVTVRFPPTTSISPEFTCAASARLSVSAVFSVSVPWFSSCADSVRAPPAPASIASVASAAFTSVPFGTLSDIV